jgi:hypothetical protein
MGGGRQTCCGGEAMQWRRGGTTLHRHRDAAAMRLRRQSLGAEAMSPGAGDLVLSRLPHGWRWADLLQQRAHAMVARSKAQHRIYIVAQRPRGSRDGGATTSGASGGVAEVAAWMELGTVAAARPCDGGAEA